MKTADDRKPAETFARREHPLCLSQPDGAPMDVARSGGRHVLKRMPRSGGIAPRT